MAAVSTTAPVGPTSASVSVPAPAVSVPVASASVPAVAVTTALPVPVISTSISTTSTSTSVRSATSSSAVVSATPPSQSGSGGNVNNAANGANHDGSGNNNLKVIIPIATVACILVIIYILYRFYLLHKGRKDQVTPLPPPRTPAIFEQRRSQSVMYGHPQQTMMGQNPMSTPASYRQSMRPGSFMYDGVGTGHSNSSLTKASFPMSGSGHSSPSAFDDTTFERPFRPSARPHSVASFGSLNGSVRGSMYNPTLRNSPHGSLRGDIILPAPLSPGPNAGIMHHSHSHPPVTGRGSRYSMFNAPTTNEYAEIRPSSSAELHARTSYSETRPTRPMSAMVYPSHSNGAGLPSRDDWTERMAVTEVESNSTCTAHRPDRSISPPPPLKSNSTLPVPTPTDARSPSPRPTSNTPSSFSGHVPGAFPSSPSNRGRSPSPPEQLLTDAFVSASESAESK